MECKVKEFVQDLFSLEDRKVDLKILEFFRDYDAQKEPEIARLQRKIDNARKLNNKAKTSQGQEFSGRSEVENLFLDCIDETKKLVVKRKETQRISKQFNFAEPDDTQSTSESENLIE